MPKEPRFDKPRSKDNNYSVSESRGAMKTLVVTTLSMTICFASLAQQSIECQVARQQILAAVNAQAQAKAQAQANAQFQAQRESEMASRLDRKSTRLNSSH